MMSIIKNALLSFLLIATLLPSYSQMNVPVQKNKLELTGYSVLKVKPDQANVSLYVSAKNKTLGQTVKEMEEETSKIIKRIKSLGFEKEDIKTSNYNVHENYTYKDRKRQKLGFVASQNILLSFPYDAKKLDKFLASFSNSEENANINFSFSVSEKKQKEVKDKLIKMAVKDARRKALLISDAAGTTLGAILNISYNTNNYSFNRPQVRSKAMMMRSASTEQADATFSEMELKETEMSDQVSIQWEIK